MKRFPLLILAFGAFATFAVGQSLDVSSATSQRFSGIPFYQIYEEKDVDNTSRGNFLASSPDNTIFFGSENGIHTFDGANWKRILTTESTREKVRALYWANGELYASGYGTIGKMIFGPETGVRYEPINKKPLSNNASEHYSNIIRQHDWLYFMGMRSVVIYNMASGEIKSHAFNSWLKTAHIRDGALYLTNDRDGMWKFQGAEMMVEPAFVGFTEEKTISLVAQSPNGKTAFTTTDGGIFLIIDGLPVESYQQFIYRKNTNIVDMTFLDEDRLALAISGQGVFIVDNQGKILTALEKSSDFRWSAVRKLHVDQQGTLWTLFNASIGKVMIDSPVTSIDERFRPNLDYAIPHFHKGELFLRNNGKLLRATHQENGRLSGFENALPDTPVSVSLALAVGSNLYVHAGSTTYLFEEDALIPLATHGRVDRLAGFPDDPNMFLSASSTFFKLLKREDSAIKVIAETPQSVGFINKIARDRDNVFWLEIGLGRLGKVWIEDQRLQFKLYDAKDGLPPNWVAIWEHEGKVLFTERTGVYTYDPATDRFVQSDLLEPYLPRASGVLHRATTDPHGNIWASFDRYNYILWKQPDGSYIKDGYSLSQLREVNVNHFLFLPNGDAILASASELFHVDATLYRDPESFPIPRLQVVEVSNVEGDRVRFISSGDFRKPSAFVVDSNQKSLTVRVSNNYSATLKQPIFQYLLEGMSTDWSKWSSSNQFTFTGLDHGAYNLRIRTRVGERIEEDEIAFPFTIKPSIWETPFAYFGYVTLSVFLLFACYGYFTRNLKNANEKLEQMVADRTREIETKNKELKRNARELTGALDELRRAQDQLMTTSRKAGMAEIATNVLHNVGNVLNSINVGVISLAASLEQQRVDKLLRVSDLIDEHSDDLATFFTTNPKGQAVPSYLRQLGQVLREDFSRYKLEVECMHENIDHVKRIIATQQTHGRTIDIYQSINLAELIDSAVSMIVGEQEHSKLEITRDFDSNLEIVSDKHRILQMMANFIKNAKESISEVGVSLGIVHISARFDQRNEYVELSVSDNGMGIDPINVTKIFTHGFTTKPDGHGFGMHSCANSAKVLGGELRIESKGVRLGATVRLTLPVAPPRIKKDSAALLPAATQSA